MEIWIQTKERVNFSFYFNTISNGNGISVTDIILTIKFLNILDSHFEILLETEFHFRCQLSREELECHPFQLISATFQCIEYIECLSVAIPVVLPKATVIHENQSWSGRELELQKNPEELMFQLLIPATFSKLA